MTYPEFAKSLPVLYGQIMYNGKSKIGSFKPVFDGKWTNSMTYRYHKPTGEKGHGAFTLMKAWQLFEAKRLSTNPEDGKPENYL